MIEKVPPIEEKNFVLALKMLMRNQYGTLLKDINTKYLYWDKVKYLVPQNENANVFWQAVKTLRTVNSKQITFGDHVFHFTITENMLSLLHQFDMNLGGSLGTHSIIPETDKNVFLISSIMEEAIASSQMEGASTTRRVAKEMLRKQQKPRNKSQQMITNNYATIKYLVEHQEEDFTIDNLLKIHKLITKNTLDDSEDEGHLRKDYEVRVMNAITGEIAHTPPMLGDVEKLLKQLCEFANASAKNETEFVHPVVKSIIIHFMLAYIHPFVDGNGRTARSLVYWYLIKNGYWLTEYLSISRVIYRNKDAYEKAFLYTENDGNDLSYFIQFNLVTMEKAFVELKSYLQRKISERDGIVQFRNVSGINERQAHLLKILSEKPNSVFTTTEVVNRFAITGKTARNDLQRLVSLGYMQEKPLNQRVVGYIRSDDFEALLGAKD